MKVVGDIRKRILHEVCNQLTGDKLEFDRDAIIRNVIVLDHFIIKSYGLEIPVLIDIFGYYGFKELLENKVISFNFDFILPGLKDEGKLPKDIFKVALIKPSNVDEAVSKCLANVNDVQNITYKQKIKLKGLIADHFFTNEQAEMNECLSSFDSDITKSDILSQSINHYCYSNYGKFLNEKSIKVEIDTGIDGYKIKSNINEVIGSKDDPERMIIKKSIFSVLSLNRHLYKMLKYNTMSAFREAEIPLYENKLTLIARHFSTGRPINNFNKVIEIANFPDFTDVTVNVDKLIKLRDSQECILFRDWLWSVDSISDREINGIINDFRNRVGVVLNKPGMKIIRWLASTGIGGIEPISGTLISIVDKFIVEKIFPNKGLTSFINDKLPSLFSDKMDENAKKER
ncbi:MAG: hypothetical protein KJ620_04325 [Candidatus Edwardsbacteria bacterium]|nr:hypothetical protein [Candidatus Edwardsbacteria bacterium]MBU1576390.1 hypothetical protein [Candidatus Edwardsbacteria bacterium]